MKSIINGFRYDTEKSDFIESASHSIPGELTHWNVGLYRTKRSKRFFLAGYGGPMTVFSRRDGNNSLRGGSKIIPVEESDALIWAKNSLDPEDYEGYFD